MWQRAILDVTGNGLAATVCSIVQESTSEPTRSDHVCARRAVKTLALAGRIRAVYLYGCLSLASVMGPGCCHEEGTTLGHE
jgi:hypothetical protein